MAKTKKTTPSVALETPVVKANNEPTFERIQVNVSDLNNPIFRVNVTQFVIDNNKDVFFTDLVKAQRYAHNELLDRKGGLSQSEYSEAYWFIANFV